MGALIDLHDRLLSVEFGSFADVAEAEDPTAGGFIFRAPDGAFVAASVWMLDVEGMPAEITIPRFLSPFWQPVLLPPVERVPIPEDPRRLPGDPYEPVTPRMHPEQPRVIVLSHGRTGDPTDARNIDYMIDTPHHALYYWGFDFVAALQGVPTATSLMTFEYGLADATEITRDEWEHYGWSRSLRDQVERAQQAYVTALARGLGATIAKAALDVILIHAPPSVVTAVGVIVGQLDLDGLAREVYLRRDELHRLVALAPDVRMGRFVFHPANVFAHPHSWHGAPKWLVMIPHRDGSRRLGEQTRSLIHTVHALYHRLLDHVYGQGLQFLVADPPPTDDPWLEPPLLYFVMHSMGGIVARHMLSRPTETLAGVTLTAAERVKAADIADRTVALVTLATPHEGTPAGKASQEIADSEFWDLLNLQAFIRNPYVTYFGLRHVYDPQEYGTYMMGAHLPATQDTALEFWIATNTGVLAPQHAKRTDDSLIPIYALAGRTPSAGFFADASIAEDGVFTTIWEKIKRGELTLTENTKHSRVMAEFDRMRVSDAHGGAPRGSQLVIDALGGMIADGLIGWTTHHWGPVDAAGFDLDLVRRDYVYTLLPFPAVYLRPQADREQDTDGVIPIGSSLATHLGTATSGYFGHDRGWDVGGQLVRGSWYRLERGPWDWEHHGSIKFHIPTANWLRELVVDAGPYVGAAARSSWDRSPARITRFVAEPSVFFVGTETVLHWQLSAPSYDQLTRLLDANGNGVAEYVVPGCGGGRLGIPHVYAAPGTYYPRLTVTDGLDETWTTTWVTVRPIP